MTPIALVPVTEEQWRAWIASHARADDVVTMAAAARASHNARQP